MQMLTLHVAVIVKIVKDNIMAKKNTKKPTFIVDLTNIECCEDIRFEFVKAKATQGVAVSKEDIEFIVNYGANLAINLIDSYIAKFCDANSVVQITDKNVVKDIVKYVEKKIVKKEPWYKRFWKWVTRKK